MNIFEIDKVPENEEIITILEKRDNIKIERILSKGQTTEWMIQDKNEFVLLIQGSAIIEFEDKKIKMEKGDIVLINKGEKHRVSFTSENPYCIWLCVHF
ncbi:cupin domain-containing protein [Leptotrichia sp. OH3620_COT-345]|uniref:cupin domain-containing protein n=1 Tax=Leptotrichia sp. OH3620_COT-345 TaxID=2491048 RepID=UPI000F646EB5|nr:cupin domain-containing protein [Leptotrichia sp. OH3620_COT-345]RRD39003.1 cupin domain-containing protein [Leptotrichia sp. OH3620_COT-345]